MMEIYVMQQDLVQAVWVMSFTVDWIVENFLTPYERATVAFKRSRCDPELIIDGKTCQFGDYLVRDTHGTLAVVSETEFMGGYNKVYTAEDMAKILSGVEGTHPGDIMKLMEKYKIPAKVLIDAINEYIDTDNCKKRMKIDGYPL